MAQKVMEGATGGAPCRKAVVLVKRWRKGKLQAAHKDEEDDREYRQDMEWYWRNCTNPEESSEDEGEDLQEFDCEDEQEHAGPPRRFFKPSPQKLMKVEVERWERRRRYWQDRREMRAFKKSVGLVRFIRWHFRALAGGGSLEEEVDYASSEQEDQEEQQEAGGREEDSDTLSLPG